MDPGAWNPAFVVIMPDFQLTMVFLLATLPASPALLTNASALSPSPSVVNSSWMPAICMNSM
eukprot:10229971-Heterocapsa_arctica.AAC.1